MKEKCHRYNSATENSLLDKTNKINEEKKKTTQTQTQNIILQIKRNESKF